MICPRCKNNDKAYFQELNGRYYCRKCIQFGRVFIDEETIVEGVESSCNGYFKLDYTLSEQQAMISKQLVERYKNNLDSTVKAVCGAGKTEIVFEVIQVALQNSQRVCFTTPRTELTKELYNRIIEQFFDVTINLVCGGCHDEINGQFIVCTTHQLFRFECCFDLLVLDEYDAFPYCGDMILNEILKKSIKGQAIYLSATMTQNDALVLSQRYHGHKIPVPVFVQTPFYVSILLCMHKIKQYRSKQKPVLVFVSNIEQTKRVMQFLQICSIRCNIVHSKIDQGLLVVEKLKQGKLDAIICTTILERGVTIENVQVIILEGEQRIYDYRTLIQIAGRVGRKINHPTGDVWIYGVYKTKGIRQCIEYIKQDNASVV